MNVEKLVEWELEGESKVSRQNIPQATLSCHSLLYTLVTDGVIKHPIPQNT